MRYNYFILVLYHFAACINGSRNVGWDWGSGGGGSVEIRVALASVVTSWVALRPI